MHRQACRRAAGFARQVSSAFPESVSATSLAGSVELVHSRGAWAITARSCPAQSASYPAAASAAAPSQPWLPALSRQQGAFSNNQQPSQCQPGENFQRARQAVQHNSAGAFRKQRHSFASAQAVPVEAASSSSSGSDGLALSDSAVERLKELQAESSVPVALRVTVEGGGCSGFQYEFAIEEGKAALQLAETDRLFERDGVRVVCDDISLEFLKGARVDYESDLMRSAFVIEDNPNAAASCGCGSSFVAK